MMAALRGPGRATALLAAICAVLAAVVVVEAYTSPDMPTPPVTAPAAAEGEAVDLPGQVYEAKPPDSYAEIAARPVFSPSRRPQPADARNAGSGSKSGHDNLMLAGVIMGANKRLAMIETKKTPSVVVVREGQIVEGWTVETIQPEKVVISQGVEAFELLLDDRLKMPRKEVRRTPRSAPAAAASAQAPQGPPADAPASAPAPAPNPGSGSDALPPREDGGASLEDLNQ